MVKLVVAHILALLLAPIAATASVLLLAQLAGRLTRWHSATGGSEFMFSMPIGGLGWQVSSAIGRAAAAFGVARLVFWLFGVAPTAYMAAALIILFVLWDLSRFRQATRPPLRPPTQAVQVLWMKVVAGLIASLSAGILFIRV